jgi:hypothetical protein
MPVTPEERELIAGLFERMRSMGAVEKDREAEAYISQSMRQTPDAAYMLVQSVLVQERALQQSGAQIEELEDRLRELERGQPRASGSGSFLGGLFGGGRAPEPRGAGSVPAIGSRSEPSQASRADSPWGGAAPGSPPQGGGGGFMRSAMATAAGVAGGMLAADAIRNMMGGNAGQAHAATGDAAKASSEPSNQKQEPQQEEPQYQDANDNDPGNYDSDSSSWGGGDDLDI